MIEDISEVSMRFSLVVTTLGRTQEVERLMSSLDIQTYRNFELIVVDQNKDDRLAFLFKRFEKRFAITRIGSERGASRGRNAGIRIARGNVISFPDDDCWYPPTLLQRVAALLSAHPEWDGLAGRPAEAQRWSSRPGRITRTNAWGRAIEWTLFHRRDVVRRIGYFNETLGPGINPPGELAKALII